MGRAAAIAYAREGADVAIHSYPTEEPDASEVIQFIKAAGRTAVAIPGDLRDRAFCQQLVMEAVQKLGSATPQRLEELGNPPNSPRFTPNWRQAMQASPPETSMAPGEGRGSHKAVRGRDADATSAPAGNFFRFMLRSLCVAPRIRTGPVPARPRSKVRPHQSISSTHRPAPISDLHSP